MKHEEGMGEDIFEVTKVDIEIGVSQQQPILYPDTDLGTFLCAISFNFTKILQIGWAFPFDS